MTSNNIYNLFKFLEINRGEALPFEIKVLYENEPIDEVNLYNYIKNNIESYFYKLYEKEDNFFLQSVIKVNKYINFINILNSLQEDSDLFVKKFKLCFIVELCKLGTLDGFNLLLYHKKDIPFLNSTGQYYYTNVLPLITERILSNEDIAILKNLITGLPLNDSKNKRTLILIELIEYLNEKKYEHLLFEENDLTDLITLNVDDQLIQEALFDVLLACISTDRKNAFLRWIELGADVNLSNSLYGKVPTYILHLVKLNKLDWFKGLIPFFTEETLRRLLKDSSFRFIDFSIDESRPFAQLINAALV